MTKTRINGQFLEHHVAEFHHMGRAFTRTVYPARVQDLDGVYRDFYPSANEELVEHALRKLAVEQQAGYFDKINHCSGVVFTLYQLRQELENRGHARSFQADQTRVPHPFRQRRRNSFRRQWRDP